MINLQVLDAAIAYVEQHPDEYLQRMWFTRTPCGTACCIAGTVVSQAGWKPVWESDGEAYAVSKDGQERDVDQLAVEILGAAAGLETALLHDMFSAMNSLDRVKEIRDKIAERQHG